MLPNIFGALAASAVHSRRVVRQLFKQRFHFVLGKENRAPDRATDTRVRSPLTRAQHVSELRLIEFRPFSRRVYLRLVSPDDQILSRPDTLDLSPGLFPHRNQLRN